MPSSSPMLNDDLVIWNHAWELKLSMFYGHYPINDSSDISNSWLDEHDVGDPTADSQRANFFQNDASVQLAYEQKSELCLLQRDLSQKYSLKCALHNFEASWIAKTLAERSAIMIQGLKNTFTAHSDLVP